MNKEYSMRQRLRKVISDVFECEESTLPANPDQASIDKWDSLEHLRLIMAVESEFNIKFQTERIPMLTSLELLIWEITNANQ